MLIYKSVSISTDHFSVIRPTLDAQFKKLNNNVHDTISKITTIHSLLDFRILFLLMHCNKLRNARNVSLEKNGSDRILGQRPSFETVTRIHPFHDLREDCRKKRGEERRSTPLHENPLCDEQWPRPTDWQIHPYFLSVSFRLIASLFFSSSLSL